MAFEEKYKRCTQKVTVKRNQIFKEPQITNKLIVRKGKIKTKSENEKLEV